jgi:hypothetical protein
MFCVFLTKAWPEPSIHFDPTAAPAIIENPEAYLYTVASNLAKEHSRLEGRSASALDIDDLLVQQQLAVLPSFGAEMVKKYLGQAMVHCRKRMVRRG